MDTIETTIMKTVEFNVDEMKKNQLKLLAVVVIIGALLVPVSKLAGLPFGLELGVIVLITVIGYLIVLFFNLRRAARRVVFTTTGFYVNDDWYAFADMNKIEVKPFLPFAGQADNIYLTVRRHNFKRRYWVGVKGDPSADASRQEILLEVGKLTR